MQTNLSRRAFLLGATAAGIGLITPSFAVADTTEATNSGPRFSFSLSTIDSNGNAIPAANQFQNDSPEYSVIELGESIKKDTDRIRASYEIGLVKPNSSTVAPLSMGASYDDPLVRLEVEFEYGFDRGSAAASSIFKICYASARITRSDSLLVTGTRTHAVYAGITGSNVMQNQFDTYSRLEPDWGWVPYSPTGSTPISQNGTRAAFEAWPAGMEGSTVLVEAIAEF